MIRIITDSAADLSPAEYKNHNITCIPLTVMFGENEFRENVNLSKDQFYELLLSLEVPPKTAQPSPQCLMELFESAHESGDGAIYIPLSSGISGTYQTALMTKNMLGYEDCHVADTLNATGGQRLIVQHAAKLRDEGKSADEIIAGIEDIRSRICLFACIDTLEYLYKGGRISQTVYKLGTLANIKPIVTVEPDGTIGIPAKAMGMRKGMDILCKHAAARPADPDFPFYVMYTNNRDVARDLAKKLKTAGISVDEDHIIQVGAAIGSHIGPDACGLVYVAAK
jgi:DegV family protein with EDD domain